MAHIWPILDTKTFWIFFGHFYKHWTSDWTQFEKCPNRTPLDQSLSAEAASVPLADTAADLVNTHTVTRAGHSISGAERWRAVRSTNAAPARQYRRGATRTTSAPRSPPGVA